MSEINKKRIAIFGSTGSIGTQTLEVISANPDLFEVEILTAQTNDALLIEQALKYQPNAVVIGDENKYETVKSALSPKNIKVFTGPTALEEVADFDNEKSVPISLFDLAAGLGFVLQGCGAAYVLYHRRNRGYTK